MCRCHAVAVTKVGHPAVPLNTIWLYLEELGNMLASAAHGTLGLDCMVATLSTLSEKQHTIAIWSTPRDLLNPLRHPILRTRAYPCLSP